MDLLMIVEKIKVSSIVLSLSFTMLLQSNSLFAGSESASVKAKKVVVPLLDWSSQRVISKAVASLLPDDKYHVVFESMSEELLWGAMARGKVHFQLEIWQASAHEDFQKMLDKQRILDLGAHQAITREDWWYPTYVEELCPGLPDWRALNECAALFSLDGTQKGTYLTGPWPYRDPDLIRSLALNFKIKRYKDSEEIWQALAVAKAKNKAIVLLNWTPNWTDQRVPGKFVSFPQHSAKCETDPSWGINSKLAFDCGNVTNGWIKKAATASLPQEMPCLYQFIQRIDLTNKMISQASALVDYDKLSEEDAAAVWLTQYRKEANQWLAGSCIN